MNEEPLMKDFDDTPAWKFRPPDIEYLWCPFCLKREDRRKFEHFTKAGEMKMTLTCPFCGKRFRQMSVLTEKTTVREYASFVAMYSKFRFWKSIDFEQWKGRLNSMGFADLFWKAYREFKPKKESELDEKWD